ncbi:MAG TPA: DUF6178 family protein [Vicinamibacterales bacterium]|nr:DUF6178 family protein [Vicinamibacterales bacterium]
MPKRPARIRRRDHSSDRLLDRILSTPQLAQVVPRLQPDVLHRLIQHCGLDACGEIVALATPEQLARVFDLDLWRADRPGFDEQFDADRFGAWLEMIVEAGAAVAAKTLAAMDDELVSAGLAHHVRVFDCAAVSPYVSLEGEQVAPAPWADEWVRCEIGGYIVIARRTAHWDAIAAALTALGDADRDCFTRVMSGCRTLSNSRSEVDGLDDLMTAGDQAVFDVAFDREQRRDAQGYVTPAQARAFLQAARQAGVDDTAYADNGVARAYFRDIDARAPLESTLAAAGRLPAGSHSCEGPDVSSAAVDAVVDLLHDAGVLNRAPRALLDVPKERTRKLARIHAQMQFVHDHHPETYTARNAELAFLANALMAGTSIQARSFRPEEASSAAVSVCNLGLENWPLASEDVLVAHDLIQVFQAGWRILYEKVCMYAAERLVDALTPLQCTDGETAVSLDALRATMTRHWRAGTPWAARDALDVIAILDTPAWAALLGLVDEFPVLHAALRASMTGGTRAVDPSAFEFISENSQIAMVHEFLRGLSDRFHT